MAYNDLLCKYRDLEVDEADTGQGVDQIKEEARRLLRNIKSSINPAILYIFHRTDKGYSTIDCQYNP